MHQSAWVRIRTVSVLFLMPLLVGCTHQMLQVVAENKSGEELENVTIFGDGKTYEFGVLPDDGLKGYMSAEMLFGDAIPSELKMEFQTEKGTLISRSATIEQQSAGRNKLHLTIDGKYNVTGTWEKIAGQ